MKFAEKVLVIAVVAGLILKFSLIRGGSEFLMVSLLTLSGIYFALGFLLFNQIRLRDLTKKGTFENLTVTSIVVSVMTGIALSIICVGALFKLLGLPGSDEMLMFGAGSAIVISIIAIVMKRKLATTPILIRTVIFAAAGIVLFFTSNISIIRLEYRNHPAYIEAYTQYTEDPENELLWEKTQLEYHRIWMSEEDFKEYEQSQ
jgi:hypothetical protein